MILILERDLTHPKFQGFVVSCGHCQRFTDKFDQPRPLGQGFCAVLRISVDAHVPRLCSAFEERL